MKLPPELAGERLDRAVARALSDSGHTVSVREVRAALRDGRLTVNGRRAAAGTRAVGGEEVDLEVFVPRLEAELQPEPELAARVAVLFEDDAILVLDKPSGVPTHPLYGGERGTLLGAAVFRAPQIADGPPLEGGLVHRLDVDTSGVVIFAKTAAVREGLRADFKIHRIQKRYLALVDATSLALPEGVPFPGWDSQELTGSIGPGEAKDRVRVVEADRQGGLPAVTHVGVLERFVGAAWVEAVTRTGRRHQVRAHLAHAGAPIAGDEIYGAKSELIGRLALHAEAITLQDGRTFRSPIPDDLQRTLHALRAARSE